MVVSSVEINPWEKFVAGNPDGLRLSIGDSVVISTEFGEEAGLIKELKDSGDDAAAAGANILRLATEADDQALARGAAARVQALADCRQIISEFGLEMKVVDCHFSIDGQRLSFAFVADGRIDFRDLVKELGRHFQKVIRLHQLGVRDEAKIIGDVGSCGISQCCKGHLKKLGNVSGEFAEDQQIAHRGSDRLSGICGRLKCCLAYEESHYQEIIKSLPPVGTRVKTKHGRGIVTGWHVLKGSVDVRLDPSSKARSEDRPVIVEIEIMK